VRPGDDIDPLEALRQEEAREEARQRWELRDRFAAAALSGLLAAFKGVPGDAIFSKVGICEDAYLFAAQMLVERGRHP
jgi:hypothetical protein